MAKKITKTVLIEDINFDEDLYPRTTYNWQTAYDYSQSMRSGSKFPKITLALLHGKLYLVDGKHRIEAFKVLKIKKIEAEIYSGWSKQKIYVEAVKANISHGRVLSPYEKRLIAVKLLEMKYKGKQVSQIIQVPMDKLKHFVSQRAVNTLTGSSGQDSATESSELAQVILKSGIKHFSGKDLPEERILEIQNEQRQFYMNSQIDLLTQLINILEKDLLDLKDPIIKSLYQKLKKIIK